MTGNKVENIHVIDSKKFKTVTIVVKFKADLRRESITKRALLPFLLEQGTRKYPSEKQLNIKLNELYGASLAIHGGKKGDNHIISFHLEVANQKYIENESTIMDEALDLLKAVIYEPNVTSDAFPTGVFNREKQTLENKIKSVTDDKIVYANRRLIDEMCANETYSIHANGYVEDLASLTEKAVYDSYKQMITEDKRDIYVIGDFDAAVIETKVAEVFPATKSAHMKTEENLEQKTIEKVNIVKEIDDIQQAKLHIGFRTNIRLKDDDYYALQIFNGLFGGFPSSKLFVNVREKHSLAYYVGSRIESHKGLIIVLSGIATDDYEQAKEIIEAQFAAMVAGDFTDENVAATKDLVKSQMLETGDSARGAIELRYEQVIANKDESLESYQKKLAEVTREDVIKVAQKIEMDTIYLLTGESGGKDE